MSKVQITGFYYRGKYNANYVSFIYNGNEYATNGTRFYAFDNCLKTQMTPIERFDVAELCHKLSLASEYNDMKKELRDALEKLPPFDAKAVDQLPSVGMMTIDRLYDIFADMKAHDMGKYIVYVGNNAVCDDDYAINNLQGRFVIRGSMYNMKDYERLSRFQEKVKEAWEEFYNGRRD